jgi:hypothetical protein
VGLWRRLRLDRSHRWYLLGVLGDVGTLVSQRRQRAPRSDGTTTALAIYRRRLSQTAKARKNGLAALGTARCLSARAAPGQLQARATSGTATTRAGSPAMATTTSTASSSETATRPRRARSRRRPRTGCCLA